MTLSYDGTRFSGWQIQPNAQTIQEHLQIALRTLTKNPVTVIGSGRTDAGVHALGQVAHFKTEKQLTIKQTLKSLNGLLPHDIRVNNLSNTTPNFHAQYSARSKLYHYHLYLDPIMDPFKRLYVTHIKNRICMDLIKDAASLFVGKHDFTSFANEPGSGAVKKNPIRNLKRLDVCLEKGGVRLEFEADGFLYKMVRNIVGILIEVASGKRPIDDIPTIFASKDRKMAGKAAPPQGLFLVEVTY